MRQRGSCARLPDEALAEQRRVTARGGKNLDGDVALEAGIDRTPHLAHSAGAEARDDLVMQQLAPDHEGVTFSIDLMACGRHHHTAARRDSSVRGTVRLPRDRGGL